MAFNIKVFIHRNLGDLRDKLYNFNRNRKNMGNFKKYLPSKNFIAVVLFLSLILGLFLGIKQTITYFKNRKNNKEGKVVEVTVGGVIQKDSNNNGIADWEEYLWGLNPNKNGEENKAFILEKKKSLLQNNEITNPDDSVLITENEMLSREFFATIISLQQTGNLNEESMQSIAEAIGQTIEAKPIANIYTQNEVTMVKDSETANKSYYESFVSLATKYENSDIGSELTLISQGIGSNDPQALFAAKTVASAYRSFGKELLTISAPGAIANIHLSLANNYEKTAQSIEGLTQILIDPIIGMRAIINYKQYTDAIVSDIEKISEILQ